MSRLKTFTLCSSGKKWILWQPVVPTFSSHLENARSINHQQNVPVATASVIGQGGPVQAVPKTYLQLDQRGTTRKNLVATHPSDQPSGYRFGEDYRGNRQFHWPSGPTHKWTQPRKQTSSRTDRPKLNRGNSCRTNRESQHVNGFAPTPGDIRTCVRPT